MTQVNESIFQNFCKISKQVQEIQTQVEKEQISPEKRVDLHKELESLQGSLEKLKENSSKAQFFAVNQFEQLNDQMISLYKVIEDRFEDYEISLISKGALELGDAFENQDLIERVDSLKSRIQFLFKHRKLSLQHDKIVILSEKIVNEASKFLEDGNMSEHMKVVNLLKTFLQEALVRADNMMSPYAAELVDIAELYFHGKDNEAKMWLKQILHCFSSKQKKQIENARSKDELISILLEIAHADESHFHDQVHFPVLLA